MLSVSFKLGKIGKSGHKAAFEGWFILSRPCFSADVPLAEHLSATDNSKLVSMRLPTGAHTPRFFPCSSLRCSCRC